MELIRGIHDSLSMHVLTPFSRLQRSTRPATRATQQAFNEGLRFRREAAAWTDEQKRQWILERIRTVVRRAYDETVYYRELFDRYQFDPRAEFTFDDFARLPMLTRADIQNAGRTLLASSVPADQLRKDSTGGSTGVPTVIWLGPNERGWRDSGMERFFEMLGIPEGSRTALLWGHHLDPKASDSLRERYQAFVANTRYFDSLRLSPATLELYHQEFERFRPAAIIAYASALGQLAEYILERGYKPNYPTRCLVTGAEKLWTRHRRFIEEAFGLTVHERYGSRDAGCIGVQLEPKAGLQYTVDWAYTFVEPQTTDPEAPILITKLQADGMPMIRYQIGDVARFPKGSKPGHPVFVLPDVMGRVVDRISLPNGGWVSGVEIPHLMKDYPVREFLLLQRPDHSVELQIVPEKDFDEASMASIRNLLSANMPGLPIKIELKDAVARTVANKWRAVISEVKVDSEVLV